ncbi:MAG: flagellar basal body L-ring protein FlgH [Proteobacteria bacterium]|nr:flagellar basal body L-ring protein FlgH [Pseudomonadota bacterium]MDA0868128.1 flagellar basal body L-ring protein FlgH [Pseudomonadota bacterium]
MKTVWMIAALWALAGCATTDYKPLTHSPDFAPVYPAKASAPRLATGSIYSGRASESLFGQGRQFAVGDIITVLLNESAQAARTQNTEVSREATNDVIPTGASTELAKVSPVLDGVNLNTATIDSKGSGSAGQQASLNAQIAVTVVQVLANGNLVLRGEKQLALSEGAEVIQVAGVIRPSDVSPNNTVQSRRLANAQIAYRGQGELTTAARSGWGTQGLLKWWPF